MRLDERRKSTESAVLEGENKDINLLKLLVSVVFKKKHLVGTIFNVIGIHQIIKVPIWVASIGLPFSKAF